MSTGTADAEALAAGALEWLPGSAREIGPELAWTGTREEDELNPTLYSGAAGIVITLLEAHRHSRLALLAVAPCLRTAEPTAAGAHWEVRAGTPARSQHISHGTLGIAAALAAVGHQAGRPDLVDLALAGAADMVSRDEAGPSGFLVPHSDPRTGRTGSSATASGGATGRPATRRCSGCSAP